MPTLIEMRLKATWTVRPDTRQLHGLACALFEGEDASHSRQVKPFAVWPLRPLHGGVPGEWAWRASWLPDSPVPGPAATADQVRAGHVGCAVTESSQRTVTHARLAASPGLTAITVRFESPAYFSQNGSDIILPDPRLIVGSWRRRWDTSLPSGDPLAVTDEEWALLRPVLALADYELRTERRDTGHGRDRSGFTGRAMLRLARGAPAPARKVFGTLARFAEFCGTGAQTTHGFGATSVTPLPPEARSGAAVPDPGG